MLEKKGEKKMKRIAAGWLKYGRKRQDIILHKLYPALIDKVLLASDVNARTTKQLNGDGA